MLPLQKHGVECADMGGWGKVRDWIDDQIFYKCKSNGTLPKYDQAGPVCSFG